MDVIYASLNGVRYRPQEARDVVAGLEEGAELSLEREPSNQYDANAIKVTDQESGEFIGYIEKDVAADLAPMLDEDSERFECRVFAREGTLQLKLVIEDVSAAENTDDETEEELGNTK